MRTVAWLDLAWRDIEAIHWRAAAEVCEAVERFAERGEGSLRRVKVGDRTALRLYVAPYFAWITVTPDRVVVHRVIRYARP